ncbi:LA2681 family HEPN domain-containing protein [Dyadobacter sp. 3J3]|uniref:LA2681 family HEPN domain-containing protein n=1 Tax=Dyadobacter sp. 3J3 TaxID=2606600 RepID=UPI001357D666|nr:LA2681 family HEPN domain-containing protein [Dyadobacter sp. 3J3]
MQLLLNAVTRMLDVGQFEEARANVYKAFELTEGQDAETQILIKIQWYGLLIDLGNESKNKQDLLDGIDFLEKNESDIKKYITPASYYYNLANAKDGLCQIYYQSNPGVQSLKIVKEIFQDPVRLYWMAYNKIESGDDLIKQISVNLANALVRTGRLVEAIQFLDIVLKQDEIFPQALISRANQLDWLSQVSNAGYTTALYAQIYSNYDTAIKTNKISPFFLSRIVALKNNTAYTLMQLKFEIGKVGQEIEETETEYQAHTPFRKFCIDKFLTLNEHGIYCRCVANEKDNLQIGVPNARFPGNTIAKLELLLNRIKSEYAYSRWSYYQSISKVGEIDFDTKYTNLMEGEIINPHSEMLRTSFRICYGILDKMYPAYQLHLC